MEREVITLNLKNGEITLGELWDDPKAREVFRRRFPMVMKHPVKNRGRTVTLGQLSDFMEGWLPAALVRDVVKELERL